MILPSVSRRPRTAIFSQQRLYQGIKIYFDIEQLSHHAQELMSAFELDFTLLRENYCRRQKTYINEADSTLTAIFHKLWALSEQPSLFYLRIIRWN